MGRTTAPVKVAMKVRRPGSTTVRIDKSKEDATNFVLEVEPNSHRCRSDSPSSYSSCSLASAAASEAIARAERVLCKELDDIASEELEGGADEESANVEFTDSESETQSVNLGCPTHETSRHRHRKRFIPSTDLNSFRKSLFSSRRKQHTPSESVRNRSLRHHSACRKRDLPYSHCCRQEQKEILRAFRQEVSALHRRNDQRKALVAEKLRKRHRVMLQNQLAFVRGHFKTALAKHVARVRESLDAAAAEALELEKLELKRRRQNALQDVKTQAEKRRKRLLETQREKIAQEGVATLRKVKSQLELELNNFAERERLIAEAKLEEDISQAKREHLQRLQKTKDRIAGDVKTARNQKLLELQREFDIEVQSAQRSMANKLDDAVNKAQAEHEQRFRQQLQRLSLQHEEEVRSRIDSITARAKRRMQREEASTRARHARELEKLEDEMHEQHKASLKEKCSMLKIELECERDEAMRKLRQNLMTQEEHALAKIRREAAEELEEEKQRVAQQIEEERRQRQVELQIRESCSAAVQAVREQTPPHVEVSSNDIQQIRDAVRDEIQQALPQNTILPEKTLILSKDSRVQTAPQSETNAATKEQTASTAISTVSDSALRCMKSEQLPRADNRGCKFKHKHRRLKVKKRLRRASSGLKESEPESEITATSSGSSATEPSYDNTTSSDSRAIKLDLHISGLPTGTAVSSAQLNMIPGKDGGRQRRFSVPVTTAAPRTRTPKMSPGKKVELEEENTKKEHPRQMNTRNRSDSQSANRPSRLTATSPTWR